MASLDGDGEIALMGGSLTLTDANTVSRIGTLNAAGDIDGAGDLVVSDALNWSNGTMAGSGKTTLTAGATGTITYGILSRTLVAEGDVTASSGGLVGMTGGVLDNRGTFTFNVPANGYGQGLKAPSGQAPVFRNRGLLRRTASNDGEVGFRFDNEGTVQSPAGAGSILFVGGSAPGLAGSGTWSTGANLIIGNYTWGAGTRLTGSPSINNGAAVTAPDVQGATAELGLGNGSLTLTDANTVSRIGTLNAAGDIDGAGDLVVSDALNWSNGTMAGSGKTTLTAGATGTITYGILSRTLVNQADVTIVDRLYGMTGAVLDNQGSLSINPDWRTGLRLYGGGPPAQLRNRGTVTKTQGTGDTYVEWAYGDQGVTYAATGQLYFFGPAIDTDLGAAGAVAPAPSEYYGAANATAPGMTHCAAADPVNCVTGDFYEDLTDLAVPGRGRPLVGGRSYSAMAAQAAGPGVGAARLGPGWTHPYATSLELPQGHAVLHGANGATTVFKETATAGTFTAAERVKARLARAANGTYVLTYPNQTQDVFDSAGRLLRQLDRNGYVTSISYDAEGRIDHVSDEAGRQLGYSYGASGRISQITDPLGRHVTYAYDSGGDLVTVTDTAGEMWRYVYDANHRIVSMTDPRDHETTNEYDWAGRVIEQTDPKNGVTRFAYTDTSTTVTDPRGHRTRYDLTGGLTSKIVRGAGSPQESAVSMVRDASGNVTQRTDPAGQVTKVEYDATGNATKLTDPLERVTTMTYSAANDLVTVTDPQSVTTTFTYDTNGNPASVARPLTGTANTATTSYAYDPVRPGDLITATDPNGKTWHFDYDANGNRTSVTDPQGHESTTSFNAIGWPTSSVSPRGHSSGADPDDYKTTTTYNDRGQPSTITDPEGAVTATTYDEVGNEVTVTEPGDRTTRVTYDQLDRPTVVTRAEASTLRFGYDVAGNRVSVKDGLDHETTFSYDSLDRQVSRTDPADRTTTYAYDSSGRQTAVTDAAGRTTSLGYDAASQLKSIDYSDSQTPSVDYSYDALGRRSQMDDASGTSSYTHDSLGRLTSTTDGHGRQIEYRYDLGGRLTNTVYPPDLVADTAPGQTIADPSVHRSYDDAGRIESITDWLGHETTFSYDADGNLTDQTYPNSVTASLSYDRSGRLTQRTDTGPHGTILDLPYTRKTNGQLHTHNRTGTTPPRTETLRYDALDQLDEATSGTGAGSETFTYAHDIADRLTRINTPDADTTLEYDAANQLVSTKNTAGGATTATFDHDLLGNRTRQDPTGSSAATTYSYDQANRLTHVQSPPADPQDPDIETSYDYDGDGLRSDLLWDTNNDLPLIVGDTQALYVTGPDGLPLTRLGFDGTQRYYHQDQLGSTRALTSQTATTTSRTDYDPYGNPTSTSGSDPTPFGYAGQYTDRTTGLIYMRARWYDPQTGAFTTQDPIGHLSGETNLYRYAGGDPANLTDPSGLLLGISYEDISNFAAGFGDTASLGATQAIRQALGVDNVDYCSSAYDAGGYTAAATEVATGIAGVAKAAGKVGLRRAAKGAAKIGPKITRQMGPRGWTNEAIEEARRSGRRVKALNKANGNPATRHVHPTTGQSVVIDDVTGEVIHVGGPGFKYGPGSGDLP